MRPLVVLLLLLLLSVFSTSTPFGGASPVLVDEGVYISGCRAIALDSSPRPATCVDAVAAPEFLARRFVVHIRRHDGKVGIGIKETLRRAADDTLWAWLNCSQQVRERVLGSIATRFLGNAQISVVAPRWVVAAALSSLKTSNPRNEVYACEGSPTPVNDLLLSSANRRLVMSQGVQTAGEWRLAVEHCLAVEVCAPSAVELVAGDVTTLLTPDSTSTQTWSVHREERVGVLCCCDEEDNSSGFCSVPPSLWTYLSSTPQVLRVDIQEPSVAHVAFSRGLLQSHQSGDEPFQDILGLKGKDYVVGVTDTGIDVDHCFFSDTSRAIPYNRFDPEHRKIVRYTAYSSDKNGVSDFAPGHGTHVTGTIVGSLQMADGGWGSPLTDKDVSTFHGVAPEAKVSFVDLTGPTESALMNRALSELAAVVVGDGATVMSNSWGAELGKYTLSSSSIDAYAHDVVPHVLVVFSAGNSADVTCADQPHVALCDRFTVTSPSTAKNVISVGSSMATQASWERADLGSYRLSVRDAGSSTSMGDGGAANREAPFLTGFAVKGVPGPPHPADLVDLKIVLASPSDLCSLPSNAQELAGAVVVALRGTCTFASKTATAAATGAAVLIVVNNIPGYAIIMGCPEDDQCPPTTLNAFMVSQSFGNALVDHLRRNGASLRASLVAVPDPMPDRNAETLSSFSSHGPTDDMRYKPDLVAVGEMVHSAHSDGNVNSHNCDLWATQGTSMATPLVSGLAVLVQEYLARFWSPPIVRPSAALVKALLVQSAKPLRGRYERNMNGDWRRFSQTPNFEEGHGFPVLNTTLPTAADSWTSLSSMGESTGTLRLFIADPATSTLSNRDTHRYCVTFHGVGGVFEATLVWSDPAGSTSASRTLVNNLDLAVTRVVTGDVFMGNAHRRISLARASLYLSDDVNNVEKVRVEGAAPGDLFVVEVRGTHVSTPEQAYALVASGTASSTVAASGSCAASLVSCPSSQSDSGIAAEEPCGGRGTCVDGATCVCQSGWLGASCSVPVPAISVPGAVWSILDPMTMLWLHLPPVHLDRPVQMIAVEASHENPFANVNVVVCLSPPSMATAMASGGVTDCPAANFDQSRSRTVDGTAADGGGGGALAAVVSKSIEFARQPNTAYFIGVAGMCCYAANVTVRVYETNEGASTAVVAAALLDFAFTRDESFGSPTSLVSRTGRLRVPVSLLSGDVTSSTRRRSDTALELVAELRHQRTFEAAATCRSDASHSDASGRGTDVTLHCNVSLLDALAAAADAASNASVLSGDVVWRLRPATGGAAWVYVHPSLYSFSPLAQTSVAPSDSPPHITAAPNSPPTGRLWLVDYVSGPRCVLLPVLPATTPCSMTESTVIPAAAQGISFYGEEPPLSPKLVLVNDVSADSDHGATNGWMRTDGTTAVSLLLTDGAGNPLTGVEYWSTTLSCASRDDDRRIVVCNATGLASSKRYRVSVTGLPAGVQPFSAPPFVWVSPDAVVFALSTKPFTDYTNPLTVAYPRSDDANVTIYVQGAYLLPNKPFVTADLRDDTATSFDAAMRAAVEVTFRSTSGEYDDITCGDVYVVSATSLRCVVAAFPRVDGAAADDAEFVLELRSPLLYSTVTGLVMLRIAPHPTILGFQASSSDTTPVATAAFSTFDGSLTIVGTNFPPTDASVPIVTVRASSGATAITLQPQRQTSTRLVVTLPLISVGPAATYATDIADGSILRCSWDAGVTLTVRGASKESFLSFASLERMASTTALLPHRGLATLLNVSDADCALGRAYVGLVFSSGVFLPDALPPIAVRLVPSNAGSPQPASGFGVVRCAYQPSWRQGNVVGATGDGQPLSFVACRVSPYAQVETNYSVQAFIGESLVAVPAALFLYIASTGTNSAVSTRDIASLVQVDGLPMLVGAPTFIWLRGGGSESHAILSTTPDCLQPTPLGKSGVAAGLVHERLVVNSALTPDDGRFAVAVTVDAPQAHVFPCISNGSLSCSLEGCRSPLADEFFAAASPTAPVSLLPVVIQITEMVYTHDGRTTFVDLPVDGQAVQATPITADLRQPIAFNISLTSSGIVPSLDETSSGDVGFGIYLGFERVVPSSTADGNTSGWIQCNESIVKVYGQPDDVAADFTLAHFEALRPFGDVFAASDVVNAVDGSVQLRVCIQLNTVQASAELIPTTRFVQVGLLVHRVPQPTAVPAAVPGSPAPPDSGGACAACSPLGGTCTAHSGAGVCSCHPPFRGSDCSQLCPQALVASDGGSATTTTATCSNRGLCMLAGTTSAETQTQCQCGPSWWGVACERARGTEAQIPVTAANLTAWYTFVPGDAEETLELLVPADLATAGASSVCLFLGVVVDDATDSGGTTTTCHVKGRALEVTEAQRVLAVVDELHAFRNASAVTPLGCATVMDVMQGPNRRVTVRLLEKTGALAGHNSCRVRVSAAWASATSGSVLVPTVVVVQQEVSIQTSMDCGGSGACAVVYLLVVCIAALVTLAVSALYIRQKLRISLLH